MEGEVRAPGTPPGWFMRPTAAPVSLPTMLEEYKQTDKPRVSFVAVVESLLLCKKLTPVLLPA